MTIIAQYIHENIIRKKAKEMQAQKKTESTIPTLSEPTTKVFFEDGEKHTVTTKTADTKDALLEVRNEKVEPIKEETQSDKPVENTGVVPPQASLAETSNEEKSVESTATLPDPVEIGTNVPGTEDLQHSKKPAHGLQIVEGQKPTSDAMDDHDSNDVNVPLAGQNSTLENPGDTQ